MDENPAGNGPPHHDRSENAAAQTPTSEQRPPGDTQTFAPPSPPRGDETGHDPSREGQAGRGQRRGGLFDALRGVDVRRTPDRWVGGVAAGLAHRVGLDPLVVRAGFIVLGLFFGLGIAVYLLAWALIPDATETSHLERGLREGRFASIVIVLVAAFVLLGTVAWWEPGSFGGTVFGLIVLAAIGYGFYRVWTDRVAPGAVGDHGYAAVYAPPPPPPGGDMPPGPGRGAGASTSYSAPAQAGPPHAAPPPPPGHGSAYVPTPPPPPVPQGPRRGRRRSGGGAVAALTAGALLVIVGGLVWSADAVDLQGNPTTVAWCAGLVMLGVVLVGLGLAGRRAGWVGLFAAVAALAVLVTAPLPTGLRWNGDVGDVTWAPSASALPMTYEWGAGDPTLDLNRIDPTSLSGDEQITVDLGAGELEVIVPEGLTVVVNSDVGAGEVVLVEESSGVSSGFADDSDGSPNNGRSTGDAEGFTVANTTQVGDGPVDLEVNAEVGLGQVTIISTEGQ